MWWARPAAATPAAAALLDDGERRRLGRLHRADDRARFVAAHALARLVLAPVTGAPAGDLRFGSACATCGKAGHGKPYLVRAGGGGAAPHFSVAHAGDRVVVAVTRAGPVGVDVEVVDAVRFAGFDGVALAGSECGVLARLAPERHAAARATWWVRKEAVLKATGLGLAVDPCDLVVSGPSEPPVLLEWNAPQPVAGKVSLAEVHLGAGYVSTVAVVGAPGGGPVSFRSPSNGDDLLAMH